MSQISTREPHLIWVQDFKIEESFGRYLSVSQGTPSPPPPSPHTQKRSKNFTKRTDQDITLFAFFLFFFFNVHLSLWNPRRRRQNEEKGAKENYTRVSKSGTNKYAIQNKQKTFACLGKEKKAKGKVCVCTFGLIRLFQGFSFEDIKLT